MEEAMQVHHIKQFERIYAATLTQEVTAESVVPDIMPDIERILSVDAKIFIRSRIISGGVISLDGDVLGTVLYAGEGESSPQVMEIRSPISMTCEDTQLEETDKLWVVVGVNGMEARAQNPRKIAFRAEGAASVSVYRETDAELSSRMDGTEEMERLTQTLEAGLVSSVEERAFTVSEELPLSDGRVSVSKVLQYRLSASAEDVRKVGSKMILQGEAVLAVLFTDQETGSLCTDSFHVPFSQIMDAPEGEVSASVVTLHPIGCDVEPVPGLNGSQSLELELQLTAQVLAASQTKLEYTADVYSLRHPWEVQMERVGLSKPFQTAVLRNTLKETFRLPQPAGEILFSNAACSIPFAVGESVRVPVSVSVLYTGEEGRLEAVSKKLQAEFSLAGVEAENGCFGCAVVSEPAVTVSGDQIDLRLELKLTAVSAGEQSVSFVRSVQVDGENDLSSEEAPSLVVVRPNGRTLWDLAKEYSSTRALIAAANPESADGGAVLLIPRAR